MNRYQFEDSISAYLDNELSIADRKVFEEYMNSNIDAKNLVDDMNFRAKSRWPLDNTAPYMKGPGLKL